MIDWLSNHPTIAWAIFSVVELLLAAAIGAVLAARLTDE